MTDVNDAQLNLCAETTWGTYASSGARSVEFNSETLKQNLERVRSMGLQAGMRVERTGNSLPFAKGAAGNITLHPQTKGFGLLLKMALGGSSIGTVISGKYLQTHILGSLTTKSMSVQVFRPYAGPSTSGQTTTYTGTKVTDWSLGCDVDGLLSATFGLDAKAAATGTALVAAAYPASTEPFVWSSCTITLGGSSILAKGFSLNGNNALDTNRWFLGGTKSEQTESDKTTISGSLTGVEFTSSTVYDYAVATTNAGIHAAIVITLTGQTDTANTMTITLPSCEIGGDSGLPNLAAGSLVMEQPLSFRVKDDGTNEPITITYNSTDSAV